MESVYTVLPTGHPPLFSQWAVSAEHFLSRENPGEIYKRKIWSLLMKSWQGWEETLTKICPSLCSDASTSMAFKSVGYSYLVEAFLIHPWALSSQHVKSCHSEKFYFIGEMRKEGRIYWHKPMLQWLVKIDWDHFRKMASGKHHLIHIPELQFSVCERTRWPIVRHRHCKPSCSHAVSPLSRLTRAITAGSQQDL